MSEVTTWVIALYERDTEEKKFLGYFKADDMQPVKHRDDAAKFGSRVEATRKGELIEDQWGDVTAAALWETRQLQKYVKHDSSVDDERVYDARRTPVQVEIDVARSRMVVRVAGGVVLTVDNITPGVMYDVSDGRGGWIVEPRTRTVVRRRPMTGSVKHRRAHEWEYLSEIVEYVGGTSYGWSFDVKDAITPSVTQCARCVAHAAGNPECVEVDL